MLETLRVFSRSPRDEVAKAIRELLQFDVPCVGVFEDQVLVQRTDLSAKEELLVLLHFAGEAGFSRTELGRHAKLPAPTVTKSIQALCASDCRQAIGLPSSRYRLTDLGAKHVREHLAHKLVL
ncbi:MAG: hypothetical protein AAFX79_11875 [Planctomycetota bacterium]